MSDRRHFTNSAARASLQVAIDAAATAFTISSSTGFPAVPFTATLDYEGPTEEIVLVTGLSGTTVTNCIRGYDSTAAQAHALGEAFVHTLIALDLDEANQHTSGTAGHGTAGDIVGTTDAQTLTNKTLSTSEALATAADPALKLRQFASGTQGLLEGYDNAGLVLLIKVGRNGELIISPNSADVVPLVINAFGTQAADLLQIQDDSGVVLVGVDDDGHLLLKPADLLTPAVKYVPSGSSSATFLALRDTADLADQFLLTTEGAISSAAKLALRGLFTDDPIRYPLDGSKFRVDADGDLAANNFGGRVARNTDSAPFSAGSTEVMGHSHGYPVVNGRRYRVDVQVETSSQSGVTIREVTARVSSGTVTNASNLIKRRQLSYPAGSALRDDTTFWGEFLATATGTWNVALGVSTQGGGGQTTIDASDVAVYDVGA